MLQKVQETSSKEEEYTDIEDEDEEDHQAAEEYFPDMVKLIKEKPKVEIDDEEPNIPIYNQEFSKSTNSKSEAMQLMKEELIEQMQKENLRQMPHCLGDQHSNATSNMSELTSLCSRRSAQQNVLMP